MIENAFTETREWLEQTQGLVGVSRPDLGQFAKLEAYLDLLIQWSRKVDLVALASRKSLIERHLVDSYAAYLLIKSSIGRDIETCLDVGSGAGLPGLIFAILEPQSVFYLCEPREKRQIFLKEARDALALSNVELLGVRLEEVVGSFKLICSRALGSEDVFEKYAKPLLARDGLICQLLGPAWQASPSNRPTTILNYSLFLSGPSRKLAVWR